MLFTKPKTISVHKLLVSGLGRYEQMLHRVNLEAILDGLSAWRKERMREINQRAKQIPSHAKKRWLEEVQSRFIDPKDPASGDARDLFSFLGMCIERELNALEDLRRLNADFRRSLAHMSSEQEHRQLTLKYASELGAKRHQLRGDARAFRRWFDDEAVNDRFLRRRGDAEQRLVLFLQRLGTVGARVVGHTPDETSIQKAWNRLGIERIVHAALDYEGDVRVHIAALKCLSQALSAHPAAVSSLVTRKTIVRMNELARNRTGEVWAQSEALAVLALVSPAAENLVNERLSKYEPGDDFFVRKRAVQILGDKLADWPAQIELFPTIASDSSEYVRQQFAHTIWQAPAEVAAEWINRLAREDKTHQVRASALLESLDALDREELHLSFLKTLRDVLATEQDEYVSRVAMHVCTHWLERYLLLHPEAQSNQESADEASAHSNEIVDFYERQLTPALQERQAKDESIQLRRFAAEASHSIVCMLDPKTRQVIQELRKRLDGLAAGKSRIVSRSLLRQFDQDTLVPQLTIVSPPKPELDYLYGILPSFPSR
jgi:hypothetical protein